MSDYIKREDAIKNIDELYFSDKDDHDRTREAIKRLSSADVVEVVRCKDCVYREVKGEGMTHWFGCRIMEHNDDDWYCSFGERA